MAGAESKPWLRGRAEKALVKGLTRAYSTVQVDPEKFLVQLRTAYRLPVSGYHGVYSLEMGELDAVADDIIRAGMKLAAAEGAGFGLGGLITIIPDLGILSAITMRTIQKLSLVYGFQFNTDNEIAELWIAAASAAGVDISRELLEKEVVNKFVARDSAHRCHRERRGGRKVGGTHDPTCEFCDRRRSQLLVRTCLGQARQGTLPRPPLPTTPASPATGSVIGRNAADFALCDPLGPSALEKSVLEKRMTTFYCSAVLFDLDGVLVDSTRSVDRQWRIWARERGIDEEKVMAIAHGVRAVEVVRAVAPHLDAEAEVGKLERREAADREGVAVMPGAIDLIRAIPAGHWGVVTSGRRHLATGRLELAHIPLPKVMVAADDVSNGKPHPEPYLKGAELLGVNPSECLVIEDAPAGIRAAHAGGMKVIALTSTYPASALSEADTVVEKLANIRIASDGAQRLVVNVA